MPALLADRVYETSNTTGTGAFSLLGAPTAFQTFVAGIGNGNQCYYVAAHATLNEWEIGIGTVTDATPDALSRDTILASSNGGAAVSFSAGTKEIRCTLPASVAARVLQRAPSTPSDDGTTVTLDRAGGAETFEKTLTGNRTLAVSNAAVGDWFKIRLQQDATGSRTVTWFGGIKWAGGGTVPTLTTTANKADLFEFYKRADGGYDGFVRGQNI